MHPGEYDILVMDSRPYRIDRTLSDYKGRDPLIYDATCDGLQASLLDAFRPQNLGEIVEFRKAAKALRRSANAMKQVLKSPTIFRPAMFRWLGDAATGIASDRGFLKG